MPKSKINKISNNVYSIKFYLNDQLVELKTVGANDTLLDYLRLHRSLTGTKEGCGEGDCGACTVLIGRIEQGELEYKTINACICLMPSLHASHVITVENLRMLDGTLHPVQEAMVKCHGSQCGFCTPGIVMSLYGSWLKSMEPTIDNIEKSLQGNLCRCTGYGPIIEAAKSVNSFGLVEEDKVLREKATMKNNLIDLEQSEPIIGWHENNKFILPISVSNLSELLMEYPEATIVAGATDVGLWITKDLLELNPIIFIGNLKELKTIEFVGQGIEIGACVSYSDCESILSSKFPILADYFSRIAGEQIRNAGTIGGNIANGSPIGDLAPLFIGLRGTMVLRKGCDQREITIEDFFLDYKCQDLSKSEFIEKICLPRNENLFLFVYKISKRRDEDISTVSAIFSFKELNGRLIDFRLVFGGMAPVPKRASHVENVLNDKVFDNSAVKLAQSAIENDFLPISDVRASSKYRMRLAKNLIHKCQLEYSTGRSITLRSNVQRGSFADKKD